jgi:hypothetical protein
MHFLRSKLNGTNFALMPVLLKFELFSRTFSSSGTDFSLLKLTVTSSSAVLKATKYPGLPLLILQHKCVIIGTWPSHTSVSCISEYITPLVAKLYLEET